MGMGINANLDIYQKGGEDWQANIGFGQNRTSFELEEQKQQLTDWIENRTYNKGDLAFVDGKFTAINSRVHLRFLNNDKQTVEDIREVRRQVYAALKTDFESNRGALVALQEFLFGAETVREPLTCDEAHSLLQLVSNGAINKDASYDQLKAYLNHARLLKHTNASAEEVGKTFTVGGKTFAAESFVKGVGKHGSVLKTTVNVDQANKTLFADKYREARTEIQEFVRHLNSPADDIGAELRRTMASQCDELQEAASALCGKFDGDHPDEVEFKYTVMSGFTRLQAAIDSLDNSIREANLQGMQNASKDLSDLRSAMTIIRSPIAARGGNALSGTALADALKEIGGKVKERFDGEGIERCVSNLKGTLENVLKGMQTSHRYNQKEKNLGGKALDSLLNYVRPFLHANHPSSTARAEAFMRTLDAKRPPLNAEDKISLLLDHVAQKALGRISRLPGVRGNAVLQDVLARKVKEDFATGFKSLLLGVSTEKTTAEIDKDGRQNRVLDLTRMIQDKVESFRYVFALCDDANVDKMLGGMMNDLVGEMSADAESRKGQLALYEKLLQVSESSSADKDKKLDALNQHLGERFGDKVHPKLTRRNVLATLDNVSAKDLFAKAKKAVSDVSNKLRFFGFKEAEIGTLVKEARLEEAALIDDGSELLRLACLKVEELNKNKNLKLGVGGKEGPSPLAMLKKQVRMTEFEQGDQALYDEMTKIANGEKAVLSDANIQSICDEILSDEILKIGLRQKETKLSEETKPSEDANLKAELSPMAEFAGGIIKWKGRDGALQNAKEIRKEILETFENLGLSDLVDDDVMKCAMLAPDRQTLVRLLVDRACKSDSGRKRIMNCTLQLAQQLIKIGIQGSCCAEIMKLKDDADQLEDNQEKQEVGQENTAESVWHDLYATAKRKQGTGGIKELIKNAIEAHRKKLVDDSANLSWLVESFLRGVGENHPLYINNEKVPIDNLAKFSSVVGLASGKGVISFEPLDQNERDGLQNGTLPSNSNGKIMASLWPDSVVFGDLKKAVLNAAGYAG